MFDIAKVNEIYTFVSWDKEYPRDVIAEIHYKDTIKTYNEQIIQYSDFTRNIQPGTKFKFSPMEVSGKLSNTWYYLIPLTAMEIFQHRRELNA